jgi:hypothetical protein
MPFERWGSLSVEDHVDTKALVANVLLYDRLIIPEWTDDLVRWDAKGWDPGLQRDRVRRLGELAVRRPWNAERRQVFQDRFKQLDAEQRDVEQIAMAISRRILADEPVNEAAGRTVTVVPAYNSKAAAMADFGAEGKAQELTKHGWAFGRRLALPDIPDDEALDRAIALSLDPGFRRKRERLFDWQDEARADGWSPDTSVEKLKQYVDEYNAQVAEASGKVRWRFAFTLFAGAMAFAGPIGAAAGFIASLVQFAKLDQRVDIPGAVPQPVLMFHDIENALGARLE